MSNERIILTFEDCQTREEALAKYGQFLDKHSDDLVREHAAKLLAANDSCKEITSQTTQFRGDLARQRAAFLARMVEILDESARMAS